MGQFPNIYFIIIYHNTHHIITYIYIYRPCFGNYYFEQFKLLEWVKNTSHCPIHDEINHEIGYGIAGHSMGGQATLFASSYQNASKYNLKAAVMHHPYSHELPNPTIPFLAFTGTLDYTAYPAWCTTIFNDATNIKYRGLINKYEATHLEPINPYHVVDVARYTSAFFKLYLEKIVKEGQFNWHDLIYGNQNVSESLCGGGDGEMEQCIVL